MYALPFDLLALSVLSASAFFFLSSSSELESSEELSSEEVSPEEELLEENLGLEGSETAATAAAVVGVALEGGGGIELLEESFSDDCNKNNNFCHFLGHIYRGI